MRNSRFVLPKDRLTPVAPLKVLTGNGKLRLPSTPLPLPKGKKAGEEREGGKAKGSLATTGGKHLPLSFFSKRYQLRKQIPGGQSLVYKAWDRELEMEVVLKFLPPQTLRSKESVAELKREAAVVMRLTHENIVRLHNLDLGNVKPFIVMEYIEGETLRQVVQRVGPVSFDTMIGVAQTCVAALVYAHGQGVLHRDIKPDNIMVTKEGVLKLLDFGSAMRVESEPGSFIEGTPGYMAPEQVDGRKLDGRKLDGRADVFGLGTVLWELVTGKPAFPDHKDLLHMYDKPPEGRLEDAPGVGAVLLRAMAKDPANRWATIGDFGKALMREAEKVL